MRTPLWKLALYALAILAGVATALPNLFSPSQLAALPDWLPKNRVTLGLDLRGGSHLVLEVDARALLRERLQILADDTRSQLRDAKVPGATVEVAGEAYYTGSARFTAEAADPLRDGFLLRP